MKLILSVLVFSVMASQALAANPVEGLPASVVQRHQALYSEECQAEHPQGPETFDLGQGHKLHLVPCVMGAYQGYSKGYFTTNDVDVRPVMILSYNSVVKGVVATVDLADANFDEGRKTLYTHAKFRGPADCGESTQSRVVEDEYSVAVKTVLIRHKAACDGKAGQWPVVFSQK